MKIRKEFPRGHTGARPRVDHAVRRRPPELPRLAADRRRRATPCRPSSRRAPTASPTAASATGRSTPTGPAAATPAPASTCAARGDSDGVIVDEYTPQEQRDVCEVIAWLAAQPWCTGNVGMTGISWTGFNSLQVAALRPPALKAIVTLMSTDDRYADDVHYKGGCVSGLDMLPWGGTMLHFNALPPHPQVVGARAGASAGSSAWRRTATGPRPGSPTSAATPTGSTARSARTSAAIEAAVYAIGGWTDGYHNAVLRLLAGLRGPRKGLIGPWSHCLSQPGRAGAGDRLPPGGAALLGPLAQGHRHRHHGRAPAARLDGGLRRAGAAHRRASRAAGWPRSSGPRRASSAASWRAERRHDSTTHRRAETRG